MHGVLECYIILFTILLTICSADWIVRYAVYYKMTAAVSLSLFIVGRKSFE